MNNHLLSTKNKCVTHKIMAKIKHNIGKGILVLGMIAMTNPVMANPQAMEAINKNVSTFLANQLPFMNSLGMTDATAGQSTGIIPLYVSVGVSGGLGFFNNPAATLTSNLPAGTSTDKLPVNSDSLLIVNNPAIFGRLGIPGTDFDIGVKIGMPIDITWKNVGFKNQTFGADVRYTIIQPGLVMPGISLAAGFDRMSGSLKYSYNGSMGSFTGNYTSGSSWKINNTHLTARVGYDLFIVSALAGLQVYRGFGDISTTFNGTITPGGSNIADQKVSVSGWHSKFFLGLFLKLPFVRLGAMYDREFSDGTSAVSFVAQAVF